ncbi:MAG: hypothetical protein ACJ751_23860 [Niastella sp.]|jgi:endoglucanase|uniref:hypothetical protein n=1 Tax=Niastella sp. TaxID=1869183 RepID=UPI00389A9752
MKITWQVKIMGLLLAVLFCISCQKKATPVAQQLSAPPSVSKQLYPTYNTSPQAPDSTGMSTAVQLAAKFKLGWNIGNTMEATGGETSWGNPLITESL